mmetsp:Transcript_12605/g.30939  ORF Transcript_12605/g.30939 Transcript_12605/m.30939 type:complete len:219 (-) Transcript_12605:240-896(-)
MRPCAGPHAHDTQASQPQSQCLSLTHTRHAVAGCSSTTTRGVSSDSTTHTPHAGVCVHPSRRCYHAPLTRVRANNAHTPHAVVGCTSTTVRVIPSSWITCFRPSRGWRYVSGGKSTSDSAANADRNWMSAPRCREFIVTTLKTTASELIAYVTATENSVVVDIGASSVPPSSSNRSPSLICFIPLHRVFAFLAPCVCAPTDRSFLIARVRKLTVTGRG